MMIKVTQSKQKQYSTASTESEIIEKSTPRPSRLQAQTGPHLAVEVEHRRRH